MQATFSFYRLGLLIRKQWAERGRLYILMLGAIAGLLAIAFFIWGISDTKTLWIEPLYIFLFVGLFLGGCIMAGMTFSDLSQRTTGIYYLGTPATHTEKLVCGILYAQVFYNAAYLAIFFIIKALAFGLVALHPHMEIRHVTDNAEQLDGFRTAYYFASIIFAAIQTFYLLGSVFFERFAFVKTTVAGALIGILFVLFLHYAIEPIMPVNMEPQGVGGFRLQGASGETYIYTLPYGLSKFLWWMVRYMWMPILWVVAFFRLKEKEI
jgi:hypothetical protein